MKSEPMVILMCFGVSFLSMAIAVALVIGWCRLGMSMLGLRWMVFVRWVQLVSIVYMLG